MRIRVVQSGGFAGLRRERVVETEELPEPARETFERLVASCAFFELPARRLTGHPDVIQYRVRIELSGRMHEVAFDDETASEPLLGIVACAFEEREG